MFSLIVIKLGKIRTCVPISFIRGVVGAPGKVSVSKIPTGSRKGVRSYRRSLVVYNNIYEYVFNIK